MKRKLFFMLSVLFCGVLNLSAQSERETVALAWLNSHKAELEILPEHNFEMLFSRPGLSGETFRYYQMYNGVQVYDASIAIHVSNNDKVTYHASTYDKNVALINTTPGITQNAAYTIALAHINVSGEVSFKKEQLYIYNKEGNTVLVYQVIIEPQETPIGSWEIIVNANSGEVISAKDKAVYHKKNKEKPIKKKGKEAVGNEAAFMVNGSGFVFETDPLTATMNVYGGSYIDNNDATNAALDAARSNVVLLDITDNAGTFSLVGPYAEIQDFEAPNRGLFTQGSSNFSFTRQQNGFEAVNVYYHIDKSMRYYNETLGLTLVPYQYASGVRYDPHGLSGADNSHYLPGSGQLAFGEGCVDDAEDADVIIHELGHGLHDWLTNGATSAFLGEGNGDYVAQSYKRSFGQWLSTDASYDFVFGWDGHNPCWPGRTTAYTPLYPGGLVGLQGGAAHVDGQMWASTLMQIWDLIGREKTDIAFFEGLAMTNSSTNQEQAAIAVRQAAIDIGTAGGFTCADIAVMTDRFTARGYVLPSYTCNLSVEEFETSAISIFPNPTDAIISLKNITQNYELSIYNMLGQKVKAQSVNRSDNTIDVSNLATGTYFIKFSNYGEVLKFVKL